MSNKKIEWLFWSTNYHLLKSLFNFVSLNHLIWMYFEQLRQVIIILIISPHYCFLIAISNWIWKVSSKTFMKLIGWIYILFYICETRLLITVGKLEFKMWILPPLSSHKGYGSNKQKKDIPFFVFWKSLKFFLFLFFKSDMFFVPITLWP